MMQAAEKMNQRVLRKSVEPRVAPFRNEFEKENNYSILTSKVYLRIISINNNSSHCEIVKYVFSY